MSVPTRPVLSPPDVLADDELLQRRDGRWIDHWEPEDPQFWNAVGARTAKRNLVFSILSEHVGFSVWVIWSVMVLFMPEPVWGFTVTDKFLLTTHERPDGDAVGSLAAMQQILAAIGKDAVAFLTADEFPLPYEYRFLTLDGLVTEPPEDLSERVLVFLDCGNIDRTPAASLQGAASPRARGWTMAPGSPARRSTGGLT